MPFQPMCIVTVSKISRQKGFTLVELAIVISIAIILLITFLVTNSAENISKSRDDRRLGDIVLLDQAINSYLLDKNSYPDDLNVLRTSISLPSGQSGPLENVSTGWIKATGLGSYMSRLPTDPLNNSTYLYSYKHTTNAYELDARLEFYTDKSQGDSGNDESLYETGNDLTII